MPHRRIEPDVQETGTRCRDRKALAAIVAGRQLAPGQRFADLFGERHRVLLDRAGQHHRRIGRQIAMRRIARRLDRDPREIEPGRQATLGHQVVERR